MSRPVLREILKGVFWARKRHCRETQRQTKKERSLVKETILITINVIIIVVLVYKTTLNY